VTNKYSWNDKVILVVEDDTSSLMLLQAILSRTGARLLFAEDGETAISLFESHNEIDMVLMDIRLKGLNGLEATTRIKKINPLTPVIAQTACAIVGDMEKCYEAGCNAYLSKPIATTTLLETIDYYFKKSAVQELLDSTIYSN
jgi:hypothetical protein